jgi:hypothetical protein
MKGSFSRFPAVAARARDRAEMIQLYPASLRDNVRAKLYAAMCAVLVA